MTEENQIQSIKSDIKKKSALVFSLASIQLALVNDITAQLNRSNLYKFDVKHSINTMKRQADKFAVELDRVYKSSPEKKEEFIDITNELKDIIFKMLEINE
jgi:hypothetical protein